MLETILYEQLKYWWDIHNLNFPIFEVCDVDKKIAEVGEIHPVLMAFDGLYHPIQYFCRLKEIGVDTKTAKEICTLYQNNFYIQAKEILKQQYQ